MIKIEKEIIEKLGGLAGKSYQKRIFVDENKKRFSNISTAGEEKQYYDFPLPWQDLEPILDKLSGEGYFSLNPDNTYTVMSQALNFLEYQGDIKKQEGKRFRREVVIGSVSAAIGAAVGALITFAITFWFGCG